MAITVKKSRTLKLKSKEDVSKEVSENESASDMEKPVSLQDPMALDLNEGAVKKANYVPDVICALFAVFCFIALILFQVFEIQGYSTPPTVWPPKLMVGGVPSGGSSAPSSSAEEPEEEIEEVAEPEEEVDIS